MTLRIFLLAVILFLTGANICTAQSHLPEKLGAGMAGERLRDVLITLSPQGRQVFIEALKDEKLDDSGRRLSISSAQDNIMAAMEAEPYNANALRHAYADERAIVIEHQQARQEHLVMALDKLNRQDRKLVVSQLRNVRDRQRLRQQKLALEHSVK